MYQPIDDAKPGRQLAVDCCLAGQAEVGTSRQFFSEVAAINTRKSFLFSRTTTVARRFALLTASVIGLTGLLGWTGCTNMKPTEEEPEHHNPAHWPINMLDAAEKMDVRVERLQSPDVAKTDAAKADATKDLRDELSDLVEWAPEIAADTDLKEADWIEVYRLSETLRGHLASTDVPIVDYRQDFSRLSQLLREFHQKIQPEPNAHGIEDPAEEPVEGTGTILRPGEATEAAAQVDGEVQ